MMPINELNKRKIEFIYKSIMTFNQEMFGSLFHQKFLWLDG